jgi:4-alpha-glucanotransferase
MAVVPLQDVLGLGSEARMNYPSTLGGNWTWRYTEGALTDDLSRRLLELAQTYGRMPWPEREVEVKVSTGRKPGNV